MDREKKHKIHMVVFFSLMGTLVGAAFIAETGTYFFTVNMTDMKYVF